MNPIDDRLSAYLDDELDPVEREVIEAELEASAELRAELDAIGEVRLLMRNLAPVEVPDDFVFAPTPDRQADKAKSPGAAPDNPTPDNPTPDNPTPDNPTPDNVVTLADRRRGVKIFTRSVVAVAAAFALLVGVGSAIPGADVVPAIDDLVSVHSAAAATMPMPMSESELAGMIDMGPDVESMPLMGAVTDHDYIHMVYGSTYDYVSVFRQEGRLDEGGLGDSTPMTMPDGTVAHQMYRDDLTVLVVEADGLVYTIVTDDQMMDSAMKMTDVLPDDDDGLVENAFENLFDRF